MLASPIDQNRLRDRIQNYLRSKVRDYSLIKEFNEGYCSGISSLWLYSKWLQTQPNPEHKPRDDYDWFKNTVNLICGWDGKRSLTKEESEEFERFISYIEYFQHITDHATSRAQSQGEIAESLQDTKGRVLKKEYSIGSLFTLEQLKNLLATKGIIQEGKLILISANGHATALFREKDKYFYFDSNSRVGEVETISTDQVAELIFQAHSLGKDFSSLPVGFRMFTFGEVNEYPKEEEVLKEIGATADEKTSARLLATGLHAAAYVGSIGSVVTLLAAGSDPNIQDNHGFTALMYAVRRGHTEIIRELLNQPRINVNLKSGGGTVLDLCNTYSHSPPDIKKMLIAAGARTSRQLFFDPAMGWLRFIGEGVAEAEAAGKFPSTVYGGYRGVKRGAADEVNNEESKDVESTGKRQR